MEVLVAIALKSLLLAGATLGLLAVFRRRSAAERSWIAHIGLVALVMLALAPLVLPSWSVEAPALLGQVEAAQPAPVPSPALPTVVSSIPRTRAQALAAHAVPISANLVR